MNITRVPIDNRKLFAGALLVDVVPSYEYQNGVRTNNVVGFKYCVILPALNYEKCNVKILGKQQIKVEDDAIAVKFEDVESKIYCIDGRYDVSVLAASVTPVRTSASGKQ